jgi:hypothetical protein
MCSEKLLKILNDLSSKETLFIFLGLLISYLISRDIFLIILGGLVSFFFIMWVEYQRLPKIRLNISYPNPIDVNFFDDNGKIINQVKSLRINVSNEKLDSWWLCRYPASKCYAFITFYHLSGQKIFDTPMAARWVKAPQPVPIRGLVNGSKITIYDLERLTPQSNIDIHPGETEIIDVAVRPNNNDFGYGFCNESYFAPGLLFPKWKFGKGEFNIIIEIISSSGKVKEIFKIINNGKNGDFKLAEALQIDRLTLFQIDKG